MTDRRNSDSDYPEWATPKRVWKPLAEALGGFDLDPASGAEPEPIAPTRYTKEDDGLTQSWFGDVWVNYPYGRKQHPEWSEKVLAESNRQEVESITVLAPASTDTNWFQDSFAYADVLTFVDGRISFIGAGDGKDDAAAFSSVLVSFLSREVPEDYYAALDTLGFVAESHATQKHRQGKLATDGGGR